MAKPKGLGVPIVMERGAKVACYGREGTGKTELVMSARHVGRLILLDTEGRSQYYDPTTGYGFEVKYSKCIIRAMPTIDSDGCRPPIPGHADHLFRRMASSFSWTPELVVALLRNQWTACSGILRSTSDPRGSGAG